MARRAAQCAFRSVAASTRSVLAPVRSAVAMPSRGPSVQCVSSTARHFATGACNSGVLRHEGWVFIMHGRCFVLRRHPSHVRDPLW